MYFSVVEKIKSYEESKALNLVIESNLQDLNSEFEYLVTVERLDIVPRTVMMELLREESKESFINLNEPLYHSYNYGDTMRLKEIGYFIYYINIETKDITLATSIDNPNRNKALSIMGAYKVNFVYLTPSNYLELTNTEFKINNFAYMYFLRIIIGGIIKGATDVRLSSYIDGSNPVSYRIGNKSLEEGRFKISTKLLEEMANSLIGYSIYEKYHIDSTGGKPLMIFDPFGIGNYNLRIGVMKNMVSYTLNTRVFGDKRIVSSIEALGYDKEITEHIQRMTNFDTGLILVTGPQKSGKTTTNTAVMNVIAERDITVMEISNPPETGLRADQMYYASEEALYNMVAMVKKMDLDVVLTAEIPDKRTGSQIYDLLNSSVGVYTTMHLERIWYLGYKLSEYFSGNIMNIVTQLKYVLCQKAFEENCPSCAKEMFTNSSNLDKSIKDILIKNNILKYKESKGCSKCNRLGIKKGIRPFCEVLFFDSELKEEIAKCKDLFEMEQLLKRTVKERGLDMDKFVLKAIEQGRLHPNSLYLLM